MNKLQVMHQCITTISIFFNVNQWLKTLGASHFTKVMKQWLSYQSQSSYVLIGFMDGKGLRKSTHQSAARGSTFQSNTSLF